MSPLFSKLNLTKQQRIAVLNAPPSFQSELANLAGIEILTQRSALKSIDFALIFVTQQSQVEQTSATLGANDLGDVIVWFAYPKGTSKNFKSDLSRDHGWEALKALGFDTVRQVAIDEDWSALRFRRIEFIGKR